MTSNAVIRIHSDEPLNEIVAGNIRALMARQRWTGRGLAAALGMSHNSVATRLRGETKIDPDFLIPVAEVLGVDAGDLLPKRKDAPHPDGPDEGRGVSRLGESNPRPIHYKDRVSPVVSLAAAREARAKQCRSGRDLITAL